MTLLTAAHGKLSALAKGSADEQEALRAALSPFGFGEAALRERRGQELWLEDHTCPPRLPPSTSLLLPGNWAASANVALRAGALPHLCSPA